jgi:hypothetical protein
MVAGMMTNQARAVVDEAAQSVRVGCQSIYGILEGEVTLGRNSR